MNNILIAYVTVESKCAPLITCNYYHIFFVWCGVDNNWWAFSFNIFEAHSVTFNNCENDPLGKRGDISTLKHMDRVFCLLMSLINDIMHAIEVVWPLIRSLFRVQKHQSNSAFLRSISVNPSGTDGAPTVSSFVFSWPESVKII